MKYVYLVATLLLSFAVQTNVDAQKKELKKARSFYDIGEYYQCVDWYAQAKELGGVLTLEDQKCIARSYYYLNKIDKAWDEFSLLENNLSGEDIFLYASTLHQVAMYEDAIVWYEKSKLQGANSLHVNDLIGSCKWALNNSDYLPFLVNPCFPLATQGQSFGVQYYNDKVVYSSASDNSKSLDKNGNPFLNLYCSDIKDGVVVEGTSRVFSNNLLSPYHVGAISFTPDKKHMYYTKTVIVGESDRIKIFVVDFDGKDWVNERPLTINSDKYDCAHPAVSPDGSMLFFVSNRPDGYGGKDIYCAEMKGPNSFGPVKNLGSTINTYGDEVYPVVNGDGKLYFSSNGHYGFGGLDIFVAEFIDNKWQNVRNMMHPFNSNRDDFCYVMDPNDQNKGFVSSNNYQSGEADVIFSVGKLSADGNNKPAEEMPPVIGEDMLVIGEDMLVIPEPTPEPVAEPEPEPEPEPMPVVEPVKPKVFVAVITSTYDGSKVANATVTITDGSNGQQICAGTTDASGQIRMNIPPEFVSKDIDYSITVSKDGYKPKMMLASLDELDGLSKEPIALTPIFNDSVLDDISGMTVPYAKDFDAESLKTLDKLAAYLLANPNIVVKLNGHTEAKGNRYGNLNVSQKMAEKAKDYVVKKGVNPDQIIPRGYGERYLKNRCHRGKYCDKSQHAENRRIEVVVWKGSGK